MKNCESCRYQKSEVKSQGSFTYEREKHCDINQYPFECDTWEQNLGLLNIIYWFKYGRTTRSN